jgi:putative phosphoesterase
VGIENWQDGRVVDRGPVTLMKIGVVSDIHCNIAGLQQALELLDDCDEIICAGDIMSCYRMAPQVLELLSQRDAHTILGNHDKIVLSASGERLRSRTHMEPSLRDFYVQLPCSMQLSFGGKRFAVFHGSPWDDPEDPMCRYIYPSQVSVLRGTCLEFDWLILGHTHAPMVCQLGRLSVVNPGSCGEARNENRLLSCAAIDAVTSEVNIRTYPETTLPAMAKETNQRID